MPQKIVDVRGRKLGGETPLICTPLVGRKPEDVLGETTTVLAKRPDVIEWRVDHFDGIADTSLVRKVARDIRNAAGDTPIILTRRSIREGGAPIELDDEGVVRLYDAVCADHNVDFVDFEMSNEAEHVRRVIAAAHKESTRVILSYHNFSYTPGLEVLVQHFLEAERLGGDVGKVAVMPRDRTDVLTLLAATAQADAKVRIPLISMSMGPLGALTRLVGGVFGSALSFAVGAGSSAPGQMPIADLSAVYDVLHRARGL